MPRFFANSVAGLAALAFVLVLLVAVADIQAGVIDNAEEGTTCHFPENNFLPEI